MLLNLSASSTSFPSSTPLLFPSLTSFPHLSHSPPLPSFLSDYLTSIPLFPLLSSIHSPYFNHLLFSTWATSATTLCLEFPYRGYRAHWFIWKCFLSGTVLHNINSPSLFFLYISISLSFSRFYRSSNDYYYQFGITSFSLSFYHSSCLQYFYFLHISPSVSLSVCLSLPRCLYFSLCLVLCVAQADFYLELLKACILEGQTPLAKKLLQLRSNGQVSESKSKSESKSESEI